MTSNFDDIKFLWSGGWLRCKEEKDGNNVVTGTTAEYVHPGADNGSNNYLRDTKRRFLTYECLTCDDRDEQQCPSPSQCNCNDDPFGSDTCYAKWEIDTQAKNPTNADAFIWEPDGTLHVYESPCSSYFECTYQTNSPDTTVKTLNNNTNIWTAEVNMGAGGQGFSITTNYTKYATPGSDNNKRLWHNIKFPTAGLNKVRFGFTEDVYAAETPQTPAGMFYDCGRLVSCKLPCEMRKISDNTFSGCTGLTSYTENYRFIEEIGTSAFYGCALPEIVIPEFAKIGKSSFVNNPATAITFDNLICTLDNYGGLLHTDRKCNMTNIPDWAFDGCTQIGKTKFVKNGNGGGLEPVTIEGIAIPSGITHIGASAFGCSINSPNTGNTQLWMADVKEIGPGAFKNHTGLTEVEGMGKVGMIMSTTTSTSSGAFEGCVNLSTLDGFKDTGDGTYIGSRAFYGCSSLNLNTGNTLGGIRYIGTEAFKGCTSLTTVTGLTNALKYVGESSFEGCTGLTRINLADADISQNGFTVIPANMFKGCKRLRYLSTENTASDNVLTGITEVGDYAFYGCSNLNVFPTPKASKFGISSFTLTGFMEAKLESPTGVHIDGNAFGNCHVHGIRIYCHVFYINPYAFADDNFLSEVYLGNVNSSDGQVYAITDLDLEAMNQCFEKPQVECERDAVDSGDWFKAHLRDNGTMLTKLGSAFSNQHKAKFLCGSAALVNAYQTYYSTYNNWTFEVDPNI